MAHGEYKKEMTALLNEISLEEELAIMEDAISVILMVFWACDYHNMTVFPSINSTKLFCADF